MNNVRIGLIGLGFMGKIHLLNGRKLESVDLAAVSDQSKKALRLAKKQGIKKTYSDYHQLLDDKSIDGVIIALQTHLHAICAKEAAEAGKDILLEKPLARTVAEGKEILSTVEKHNVKLMVSYPLRFVPRFQALNELIISGQIGEVQFANAANIGSGPIYHRAEMSIPKPIPDWWLDKKSTGGGALLDLGCHMINLLHWYFGDVSDVKCYLGYRYGLDIEDHAKCLLRFRNGTIAAVNTGWFSQNSQISVSLHGTLDGAYVYYKPPSKVKTAMQLMLRKTPQYYMSFRGILSHFAECIEHDMTPSPSGEDGLKDLEIISLAYKNQIRLD